MARISRKKQSQKIANTPPVRIWNAAIYVRLSVEDNGRDSDSIETQISIIEEYISCRPYLRAIDQFIDNGYTGTDFRRPGYSRMMEEVQAGKIDCIIVKDLSRLGRNYIETSQFIEKICPLFGLRFISVSDSYDTATATTESQLSVSLSNIVNDYYAKDISRKVTSSLKAKMERGDYIGNYAPHGYRKDPHNKNRLLICPETAPVIRRIFELRAEGISYMGINKILNDEGVPSPSQYKIEHGIATNNNVKSRRILWNKHMVTEILSNVVYAGHMAQRKGSQCLYAGIPYHITEEGDWIVVKDTHEAIISQELFDRVQTINKETLMKAKSNSGKYDHLPKAVNIYGKKFICKECGSTMKLIRTISRKGDKAYFTFKCPTYGEHGARACYDVKVRKSDFDEAVFSAIKTHIDLFLDRQGAIEKLLAIKKSMAEKNVNRKELIELKKQLSDKQRLLSGLYVDYRDELLSYEDYCSHREVFTSDILALETQIEELEAMLRDAKAQLAETANLSLLVQQFASATEISAEMVDGFIETITIDKDGSLDIRFNFIDEFNLVNDTHEKLKKEVA